MRLTAYTDYSLRMLMHLAVNTDRPVTIDEVARAYGISRTHLMKVANQLSATGYVRSLRGRGGGLRLARDPASISLAEVVLATEPDLALVPCLDPDREEPGSDCPIAAVCVLRRVVEKARRAFLDVLAEKSLADLAAPAPALRAILLAGASGQIPTSDD